jgi:hypothetical protein
LISRLSAWTDWGRGRAKVGVYDRVSGKGKMKDLARVIAGPWILNPAPKTILNFAMRGKLAVFENAISLHFPQFFILYFFFPSHHFFLLLALTQHPPLTRTMHNGS